MPKHGVIDIGTNSIRLLIAETENGKIVNSKKQLEMTRIGKGVDKSKKLSIEGIERSIRALKKFKEVARRDGIKDIKVIATSAVRDAINKKEFLERVKNELDLDIEVISGEREAELGFWGVIYGSDKYIRDILVIDIGGGSTELIIGNTDGIKYRTSINIGAVRMTDKHISTDPIEEKQYVNLIKDIDIILEPVLETIKEFHINDIFGIGGTITTLAAIAQELKEYDKEKIHNYNLIIKEIETQISRFKTLSNDKRKEINGLQPKRADIILAGSSILHEILNSLGHETIKVSDYDNLEGYIFQNL